MTGILHHSISGTHLRTASAALAFVLVPVVVATPAAQAQTFITLYSFNLTRDGAGPSGVILDAAGNLYGTTSRGGASHFGMAFMLDATGKETVLHSFTGGTDGRSPYAGLVRDAAGNLYGTTHEGGATNSGTVFMLHATGNDIVLHSFAGGADGRYPLAGVIRDATGNLYGTASEGGVSNYGTVFMVDATGNETVLYSFTGGTDGRYPEAGVIRDAAGNLYGTTTGGGASDTGTVFRLDATGKETVLHSFTGGTDGKFPYAGLVRDAAGNLYGTTHEGGAAHGGTVFRLDATGNETVLWRFTGGADGRYPFGGLVRDPAGNLYGHCLGGRRFQLRNRVQAECDRQV